MSNNKKPKPNSRDRSRPKRKRRNTLPPRVTKRDDGPDRSGPAGGGSPSAPESGPSRTISLPDPKPRVETNTTTTEQPDTTAPKDAAKSTPIRKPRQRRNTFGGEDSEALKKMRRRLLGEDEPEEMDGGDQSGTDGGDQAEDALDREDAGDEVGAEAAGAAGGDDGDPSDSDSDDDEEEMVMQLEFPLPKRKRRRKRRKSQAMQLMTTVRKKRKTDFRFSVSLLRHDAKEKKLD
jgi:hypothetical protein